MKLPRFAGPLLPLQPPFYFKNVTSCLFPLRAQLASLQRFCDGYLNIIPPELGHFRASLPYVYLILLDYGKMAAQVANVGWIAQREVVFCIPVEWYKRVDGRWVFHDWATVAPFIYVDDEISMTLGRTALGWPKSLVSLTPALTGFLKDPSGATTDVVLSAQLLPRAYAGARLEERVVMEVRSPTYASWQVPFDPNSAFAPWNVFASLARSATGLSLDALSMLSGLGIMPAGEAASPENIMRKSARGLELARCAVPWAPDLTANTINLKQFRRTDEPRAYCYQALVNGPMRYTAFNRGALLGQFAGDVSGGYAIDLTCWPSFPMVDALGLEAELIPSVDGPPVARLKPVMPLWYDVDMAYERAQTIAWRTEDGVWRDEEGRTTRSQQRRATKADFDFNTTMGAASPVVTGPFWFPEAKLTVLPLLARADALHLLIDNALNAPLAGAERFELWVPAAPNEHAYVYLIIKDWGQVASETNSIGDWAQMCLTFYVPVKRISEPAAQGGLFAVQAFAHGTTQTCTLSELYGIPAVEALFIPPPSAADRTYRQEPCSLLRVDTETLPSVGEGQEARQATVLEVIDRGDRAHLEGAALSDSAEQFCRWLRLETARKWALPDEAKQLGRVRALELLTLERPLHVYTVKQFRDAARPHDACYQALVRIPYVVRQVAQIQEITRTISVQIREFPSLHLVRRLGLVTRETTLVDGRIVHTVEAVRPFWLQASLDMKNGERLQYRVSLDWVVGPPAREVAFPELTPELEETICRSHRRELRRSVADFLEKQPETRRVLDAVNKPWLSELDPQTVIESILSREWEDRSSSSTRQITRDSLRLRLQREEAGWGSWLEDNLRWLAGLRHDGQPRAAQLSAADADTTLWLRHWEHLSLVLDQEREPSGEQAPGEHAWELWSGSDWLASVADGTAPRVFELQSTPQLDALRSECAGLIGRFERADFAQRSVRQQCAILVRKLLQLLFPVAERQVEQALDEAVDRLRRPDHCVPRATAGSERDRVFPLAQSWDHSWFHGLTAAEFDERMERG